MMNRLYDAVYDYYHKHNRTLPPDLDALVEDRILERLPRHPLAPLGYGFAYDSADGSIHIREPDAEQEADDAPATSETAAPVPEGHVRVAAIQFCSQFGRPDMNRRRLAVWIRKAAEEGARIVALPEACIPGYADMTREIFWSRGRRDRHHRRVERVAEASDGPTVRFFAHLAKTLRIYLTVPIIEAAGERYYVAVLLVDDQGRTVLHHRKQVLWDVAEGHWAAEGDLEVSVADTPYGRLGVMICRDMLALPALLGKENADIVLLCAAFYGPNFEAFLRAPKFLNRVRAGGFDLVLANWSVPRKPWWQGYGMSRVISRDGKLLARIDKDLGAGMVVADLPITESVPAKEEAQ